MKPLEKYLCAGAIAALATLSSGPLRAATLVSADVISAKTTHGSWIEVTTAPLIGQAPADPRPAQRSIPATTAAGTEKTLDAGPESKTDIWAMLASGLGLIVFMAKRRLVVE